MSEVTPAAPVTCDVLIVGYGAAGATAAIEAAEAGASVVVLERAGAPGGSSALSGGELYLGGGTSVQAACGFSDTPEAMFTFMVAALGPHADEEKLRLYCDGSVEHFDWLVAHGMPFTPSLYDGPTWMPHTTDGLMWLGENAWPFNESTVGGGPAPRGHRGPTPFYAGKVLMDTLVAAGEAAGVLTVSDTRVSSLIVEDERVVGVRARRFGADVEYRARRGVVLTTGGFVDNDAMLADHAPQLLGRGKVSDGLDDGSGITMALEVGAATRRMGAYETALTYLPALACRGMIVDADGQRFVNEDAYPGIVSHAAVDHRRGPFWVIVDEAGLEDVDGPELWGVRPRHGAETLAELEAELGMPAGSLEATVAAYNRDAAAGADRFHKDPSWLRVLEPPFAAIDVAEGFFPGTGEGGGNGDGVAGFTLGGLRTTPDGAVTRWDGSPVPGLFAAGRVTSGIHGDGYISGTSLGDGTFFGRRAGRSAAAESEGTVHG
ncbi:FAD-dependent oxidoreductase [Nocardioides sp.]|uniref:FAD-dependent oxidoreductase n=1 Tax=Nocardioides sp. TaxID=35761 RepID=UPI0026062249|nr:FAD-dependent oxidoreductase [Nocardioides sp.]